jgi:hypothetical protein
MLKLLFALAVMLGDLEPAGMLPPLAEMSALAQQVSAPDPAAPCPELDTAGEVAHEIAAAGGGARLSGGVSPELRARIDGWVKKYARHYRVEEKLVRAVLRQESGGNPLAVSPKGAMGLMQLMPETATLMGVTDPFDPEQNLAGGVQYLKLCLNLFRDDAALALAAYNAGPQNVEKFGGIPPFAETQQYVTAILGYCPAPAGTEATAKTPLPEVTPKEPEGLTWRVPQAAWKLAPPQSKVAEPRWKLGVAGSPPGQEGKKLFWVLPGRTKPAPPLAQSRLGGAKNPPATTP